MSQVLIIDDDLAILDATQLLLECEGHKVVALERAEWIVGMGLDWPDLILLDISLSGSNGTDMAKWLKANPQTKHIPIILFSAHPDVASLSAESGADDYITKPFDIYALLSKVQQHSIVIH